jgi:hypothetical protein
MPESAVGGGNTLDEARQQYRDALRFSLETDRLPEIREYVEKEAHLGIWVRTPLGTSSDIAVREVARQLANYSLEDIDWFRNNVTAGGDPVIVPAEPIDTIGNIFAQMTQFDSLILVAGVGDGAVLPKKLVWIVVSGMEAKRSNPPLPLDELGLTPSTPLGEVFRVALQLHPGDGDYEFAERRLALLAPA